MYSIERRSEIISMLERHGKVDTNAVAEHFSISRETARRDLRALEEEGVLKRTHGGAVAVRNGGATEEYPVAVREIRRYREKNSICAKAAELIHDGDVIFADNSSTTRYLAKYIPADISVTVLTNSLGYCSKPARGTAKSIPTYVSAVYSRAGIFRCTAAYPRTA